MFKNQGEVVANQNLVIVQYILVKKPTNQNIPRFVNVGKKMFILKKNDHFGLEDNKWNLVEYDNERKGKHLPGGAARSAAGSQVAATP